MFPFNLPTKGVSLSELYNAIIWVENLIILKELELFKEDNWIINLTSIELYCQKDYFLGIKRKINKAC